MDIKRLFNFPVISPVRAPNKSERVAKFDNTEDRDANGQESFQQRKQQQQEPLTDEQIEKAIQELQMLPAVKEHHWQVVLSIEDSKKFVLIKDNLGKIIRKIPESELSLSHAGVEGSKGHLLKRTA